MQENEMVCYCNHVTKGQILEALKNGAKTLDDIRKMTGACVNGNCKELSPTKKCCAPRIKQIIDEFQNSK